MLWVIDNEQIFRQNYDIDGIWNVAQIIQCLTCKPASILGKEKVNFLGRDKKDTL